MTRTITGGYWTPHLYENSQGNNAEWEKDKTYEKNVAVTYGGDTYISRQYVPMNIEITNNDFWCKMSNYNAQMQLLQNNVDAYKTIADETASKYDELKSNYDNQFNKVKHIISYSTYRDLYEDDDSTMNAIVNEVNENPGESYQINFDVSNIHVTTPRFFTRGNLILDFQYCTVHWINYANLGDVSGVDRMIGFLNFKGESKTSINVNWSSGVGSSPDHFSYTGNDFKEGDYVITELGVNSEKGDYNDVLLPYVYRLCKVVSSIGNNVEVDYKNPWKELTNNLTNKECVKHADVLENITIKNMKWIDETVLENAVKNEDEQYAGRSKNNLVDALYFYCCANINIENCSSKYNTFCYGMFWFCYNIYINNFSIIQPQIVGGGEGYGFQIMNSTKAYCNNMFGLGERHLIDCSASSNIIISNSYSSENSNKKYGSFCQHGSYEHDIIYFNCHGTWNISYSGSKFGNAGKNITLDNCSGWYVLAYQENLKILNSEMWGNGFGTINTNITNSIIHTREEQETDNSYTFHIIPCQLRGKSGGTCLITNSQIIGNVIVQPSLEHWNYISFTNTKINLPDSNSFNRINVKLGQRVKFNNCDLNVSFLTFSSDSDKTLSVIFDNCNIVPQNLDLCGFYELSDISGDNNTINLKIKNNTITPQLKDHVLLKQEGTTGDIPIKETNKLNIYLLGNIIEGDENKNIKIVYNQHAGLTAVSNNNIVDSHTLIYNNDAVIKGTDITI